MVCKVAAWSMGNSLAWCCVTHSGPTDVTECLCHCSSEWTASPPPASILLLEVELDYMLHSRTRNRERDSGCTKKTWRSQLLLEGLGTDIVVLKSVYLLSYFLPVCHIFRIAIVSSFTLASYAGLTLEVWRWDTLLFSKKGHWPLLTQEILKMLVQHFLFVLNCIP